MGTGVLVIKLDDCIPFMNALSQLSNISNKADVKVSPFSFSVITTHPHLGFTATLNFSPQRFAVYAVDQYYSFSISLQFFHNAMSQFGQAQDLPSLCITALLLEPTKTIILNFTSPTSYYSILLFSRNSFNFQFPCSTFTLFLLRISIVGIGTGDGTPPPNL